MRARERERERFTSEKVKFEGYKLIVYANRGREKGLLGFSYSVCIMGRIVDQTGPIICIFLDNCLLLKAHNHKHGILCLHSFSTKLISDGSKGDLLFDG